MTDQGRSRRSGAVLLDFSLVAPGGSTVHAAGFLAALARRSEKDVLVALPADPSLLVEEQRRLEQAGIETVRIGSRRPPGTLLSNLSGQVALPWLALRRRPSVVFVAREGAPLLLPRPYVVLAANLLRWRSLDELQGGSTSDAGRRPLLPRIKSRVAGVAARRADAVVAPSQVIADVLPPGTDARVIPFGVDLDPAPPRPPDPDGSRPVRLVALGNLTRHKQVDVVIDVAAALGDEHGFPVTLDLWGDAPTEEERARIAGRLEARLGDRGRLRGYVDPADRRSVLVEADVLVVGSGTESFGFPLLEAMRTSTLVVAPDAPIARELGGGLVVPYPEGDASAAARLLAPLLAPSRRSELEERLARARRRSEQYTWEGCVVDTLEVVRGAGGLRGDARSRVALFQPVLSHYRVDLFNAFDEVLGGGLTVFTVTAPSSSLLAGADDRLTCARRPARTWRLGPLWAVPSAVREVGSGRWDAVVLSWNARQVEILPALLVGRARGVGVVLWGHGLGRRRSFAATIVRRWQAHLASAVVTYGEVGRQDVLDLAPGQRVRVLENTTGRPVPDPAEVPPAPLRRVAHLGRLLEHKQARRLFAAVAVLRDEGLDLAIEVVGDGPDRPALELISARLGIEDRVTWHGQVTDWATVRDLVQRADLVVLPERAGLAVADGFAASRPVVVLDDPRANPPEAEMVVHEVTGLRYAPPTVDALVACLRDAYAQPALLREMATRAGQYYRDHLGLDTAAVVFADLVDEVVAIRTGAPHDPDEAVSPSPR